MTPTEITFLSLPLISSCMVESGGGEFLRIEIRQDPITGRTLRGRFRVPHTAIDGRTRQAN